LISFFVEHHEPVNQLLKTFPTSAHHLFPRVSSRYELGGE
jgi:hypothetical protein